MASSPVTWQANANRPIQKLKSENGKPVNLCRYCDARTLAALVISRATWRLDPAQSGEFKERPKVEPISKSYERSSPLQLQYP